MSEPQLDDGALEPQPSSHTASGNLARTRLSYALYGLILLLGVAGLIAPLLPVPQDAPALIAHIRIAASARNEILAGQYLLLYANDLLPAFQPHFLYYSIVPYYITAAIELIFGASTYTAIVALIGISLVVSAVGMLILCRYLGAKCPRQW